MNWYAWLAASVAVILLSIGFEIFTLLRRYKRNRLLITSNLLFVGTFISALLLFLPIYLDLFAGDDAWISGVKAAEVSVQHSLRIFALDGGYMETMEKIQETSISETAEIWYKFVLAFLYVFAPILTFTFLLSFFKNLWSHVKYGFFFWRPTHIFSELNEQSLALASSLRLQDERHAFFRVMAPPLIVFSNVAGKGDGDEELIEEAKELGAILFFKDMESIKYRRRYSLRSVSFYLMEENESDKIRRADRILSDYGPCNRTRLYVFSDNIESKSFFEAYPDKKELKIEVIRVNAIRSLVYHNLSENGFTLFERANRIDDENREISAIIVGLGRYGTETLKALLWYCQFPGYRVKITAFDEREDIVESFGAMCPEIKLGTVFDDEEDMRYTLNIKSVKFGTKEFYNEISDISDVTYVFIGLGNDRNNLSAAMDIRAFMLSKVRLPYINTVVYDTVLKNKISTDSAEQFDEYKLPSLPVHIIGDLESFYSYKTVINSQLINSGLSMHLGYGDIANNFYMNDYNYFSSVASALHKELRRDIVAYESNARAAEVFPRIYAPDGVLSDIHERRRDLMRELLPRVVNPETYEPFKDEIMRFAKLLYVALADVHYAKMPTKDRDAVIERLKSIVNKKEAKELFQSGEYVNGYDPTLDSYHEEDVGREEIMRKLYDAIIDYKAKSAKSAQERAEIVAAHEYSALTDEERKKVDDFVKGRMPSIDMDKCFENVECFAYIEHIRWNAYIRSEGFRLSHWKDKQNKLHFFILPTRQIGFADRVKDV